MELGDYPQTPRVIPWKPIAIIGGGVILAIVIIVVVLRVMGGKSIIPSITQRLTDSTTSSCDEDCLLGVAMNKLDTGLCESLQDKAIGTKCSDVVYKDLAKEKQDVKLCDKISDEGLKRACVIDVLGPVTIENCATRGEKPEYCEMLKVLEAANIAQDPEKCAAITDQRLRVECAQRVPFDDPDFDELDSTQEREVYKTDPRKADTDGDGYTDGEEVRTGHNPMKKG